MGISHPPAVAPSTSLSADPSTFQQNFDRTPFRLSHSLAGHPLFEIPRLLQLAQFLRRDVHNVTFDAGDVRVDQRWKYRAPNPYTLEEAMQRIECTGAWVILKHTELDPEYKAVMDGVMSEVERISGKRLRQLTKNLEAQIMITSPGRITPYHFDNECNVLLQITGEKDLYVFDQTDREVLTEAELERFWVGDWNAGEYKARCQERAHLFRLVPGAGVHIPVNAPHWVKNDANVSVSLSVNFEWKNELVYNVYRANYFLRKIGMQPNPPGRSNFSDSVKNTVMGLGFVPARDTAKRAVRFLRRAKSATRPHQQKRPTAA